MADLTLAEALDHVQRYYARIVKPFEKLQECLTVAQQMQDVTLPAAERRLAGLHAEIAQADVTATAAVARVQQVVGECEVRVQHATGACQQQIDAVQRDAAARIDEASMQATRVERDAAARVAEATAKVGVAEAGLAETTRQYEAIQRDVDALKAKHGL